MISAVQAVTIAPPAIIYQDQYNPSFKEPAIRFDRLAKVP